MRDAEKMCRSLPPNIEIMSEKGSPTQELHVPRASKGHNNEHLEASSSEGSDSVLSEKQKSSRLRGEWLSLLEERPPTRDREKMKLWLKRVETISEPDQSSLLSSSAAASTSNGSDNDDENFYLSRLVEEGSVTVTDETNRGSQTSSNAEVKKRGEEAISTDFLQGSLSDSQD